MNKSNQSGSRTRRAFWTVAAFYFIIGFEFFYMATPFAMYFYSVYRPGLGFIGNYQLLAWLGTFFLPHLAVDTTSTLLNMRNEIGIFLTALGFMEFCIGAAQVYYHKLLRKGAVTGGIYTIIRHPQYVSLMLCSFGLLVLWPRYLVLLSFVAMVFVYYFLARLEERECESKFGDSYIEYKNRTGMFLPFNIWRSREPSILPERGVERIAAIVALYLVISAAAIEGAHFLKTWSVGKVYAFYEENAAYVSVTGMSEDSLKHAVRTVLSDSTVRSRLSEGATKVKLVNYVMPGGYYALEMPMTSEEKGEYHFVRKKFVAGTLKVVFTKAEGVSQDATREEILMEAVRKVPLLEVWIDTRLGRVTRIVSLPDKPESIAAMPGPIF